MLIGIPHSTFYYYFYPFWSCFFTEMGFSCLVSPPTNQLILRNGLSLTLDEICLPVKIHFGHAAYLAEKADVIFSPGFGRWGKKGHFCPKLMGLPDMIKLKFGKTVEFWHDLDDQGRLDKEKWRQTIKSAGFSSSRRKFEKAWEAAWQKQLMYYNLWESGYKPSEALEYLIQQKPLVRREKEQMLHIAVLGHPYLVYDDLVNQGLLKILTQAGVKVYTKETIPASEKGKTWPSQGKAVFWPVGQQILSAALYYAKEQKVDGIIFLSACLCGPDAIIGELLERYMARDSQAPSLLKITVDEHTGRAGLQTRVEAFIDLLLRRKHYAAL